MIKTLTGHTSYVSSLILLKDGSLASSSNDSTIRIWELRSGLTIKTLTGHTDWVSSLAVLKNGSLASGSRDYTIRMWHEESDFIQDSYSCMFKRLSNTDSLSKITGHSSYVSSLAVLKDGSLASGSEDKTIRIWDLISGLTIKTLIGHTAYVWCLLVLPDGSLVSGAWNSTIRIWNVKTGLTIKTLTGHTDNIYSLALLKDGSLASGSGDYQLEYGMYNF